MDGDRGELATRMANAQSEYLSEYGSRGPLEFLGATVLSFVTKPVDLVANTVYRMTGGANAAMVQSNTASLRAGSKKFLEQIFGEGTVANNIYDVLTGLFSLFISSI